MSAHTSLKPVIFALGANLVIATIKFIVAFITRSSAMLAEAIHSVADCTNQIFLLIGHKRSLKPANEHHPFGYGKEEYFWSLMVAVLLFFVGALFSIYEGVHKMMHPQELHSVHWAFIVLGISIILEAKSFHVAFSHFKKSNANKKLLRSLKETSDTSTLVILLEDFGALAGLVIVLLSTFFAWLISPIFDAIGSVMVGLLLVSISFFLAFELRKLITGESINREACSEIKNIVEKSFLIKRINNIKTMHIGKEKFILLISADVKEDALGYDIEDHFEKIKTQIREKYPNAEYIYIEAKDAVRNQKE